VIPFDLLASHRHMNSLGFFFLSLLSAFLAWPSASMLSCLHSPPSLSCFHILLALPPIIFLRVFGGHAMLVASPSFEHVVFRRELLSFHGTRSSRKWAFVFRTILPHEGCIVQV